MKIDIPTPQELRRAAEDITADGPTAATTARLAMVTALTPELRQFVQNLADIVRNHELAAALPPGVDLVTGPIIGAVVYGMNCGLRVCARREAAMREAATAAAVDRVRQVELWAWLGEDDQADASKRSGEIGLKQTLTPAGFIPMVAVRRDKMEQFAPHFEVQAKMFGKRIRLCRFTFAEVVRETEHGE